MNTSDKDANIEITIFFKDREPFGPYKFLVGARRTKHVRFNDLKDPEPIPKGTDYSSVIESDVPDVVQHTRLDSRQAENALMTTIAYLGITHGREWISKGQREQTVAQALSQGGQALADIGIPANCSAKKYCITVFVAPWCGVCRSAEPTFRAFSQFLPSLRPEVGFGIVIGDASAADNAKKKRIKSN